MIALKMEKSEPPRRGSPKRRAVDIPPSLHHTHTVCVPLTLKDRKGTASKKQESRRATCLDQSKDQRVAICSFAARAVAARHVVEECAVQARSAVWDKLTQAILPEKMMVRPQSPT